MTLAQILAITIFVIMFILIIADKIPRHYITLTCGALTIILVFGLAMRDPGAIWEALNLKADRPIAQASTGRQSYLSQV